MVLPLFFREVEARVLLALGLSCLLHVLFLGGLGVAAGLGASASGSGEQVLTRLLPLQVSFAGQPMALPGLPRQPVPADCATPPRACDVPATPNEGEPTAVFSGVPLFSEAAKAGDARGSLTGRFMADDLFFSGEIGYVPSGLLETMPTAVSAPDLAFLESGWLSGEPIRLRVYVSEGGEVRHVKVLSAAVLDDAVVERLVESLKRTRFLPAMQDGLPVASYSDIELSFVEPATNGDGAVHRP